MRPQPVTPQPRDLSHLSGTITKAHATDPAAPVVGTSNTVNASKTRSTGHTSKRGDTTKLSVYVPTDIVERARTAWRQSGAVPGSQMLSWSGWISAAIEQALLAAEREHNDGQPFAPTPAGVSPVGRTPRF